MSDMSLWEQACVAEAGSTRTVSLKKRHVLPKAVEKSRRRQGRGCGGRYGERAVGRRTGPGVGFHDIPFTPLDSRAAPKPIIKIFLLNRISSRAASGHTVSTLHVRGPARHTVDRSA
jgi:hypothetical protein